MSTDIFFTDMNITGTGSFLICQIIIGTVHNVCMRLKKYWIRIILFHEKMYFLSRSARFEFGFDFLEIGFKSAKKFLNEAKTPKQSKIIDECSI